MTRENFNQRKNELLALGRERLNARSYTAEEKALLEDLLNILNAYTYEDRLENKRFLTHIVTDRWLLLHDSFVAAVCDFDYNIS